VRPGQPRRVLIYAGGRHGVGHSVRAGRLAAQLLGQHSDLVVLLLVPIAHELLVRHPRMIICRLRAVQQYLGDVHRMVAAIESSDAAPGYREPSSSEQDAAAKEILGAMHEFMPSVFMSTQFDGLVGELAKVLPAARNLGVNTVLLARDSHPRADFEYRGAARFRDLLSLYDDVLILGDEWASTRVHPEIGKRLANGTARLSGYVLPRIGRPRMRFSESHFNVLIQFGGGLASRTELVGVLEVLDQMRQISGRQVTAHLYPGAFTGHVSCDSPESFGFVRRHRWTPDAWEARNYNLVVSRSGYNSAMEAYVRLRPTVLLPWRLKGSEQLDRAVHMSEVSPLVSVAVDFEGLSSCVRAALVGPSSDAGAYRVRKIPLLKFDGDLPWRRAR